MKSCNAIISNNSDFQSNLVNPKYILQMIVAKKTETKKTKKNKETDTATIIHYHVSRTENMKTEDI